MKTSIPSLATVALLAFTFTSHAADEKNALPSQITLKTSAKAIPIKSVADFGKEALAAINKGISDPASQKGTWVVDTSVGPSWVTTKCIYSSKDMIAHSISKDQLPLLKANLERAIKSASASNRSINEIGKGSIERTVLVGHYNLDLLAGIKLNSVKGKTDGLK